MGSHEGQAIRYDGQSQGRGDAPNLSNIISPEPARLAVAGHLAAAAVAVAAVAVAIGQPGGGAVGGVVAVVGPQTGGAGGGVTGSTWTSIPPTHPAATL